MRHKLTMSTCAASFDLQSGGRCSVFQFWIHQLGSRCVARFFGVSKRSFAGRIRGEEDGGLIGVLNVCVEVLVVWVMLGAVLECHSMVSGSFLFEPLNQPDGRVSSGPGGEHECADDQCAAVPVERLDPRDLQGQVDEHGKTAACYQQKASVEDVLGCVPECAPVWLDRVLLLNDSSRVSKTVGISDKCE